MQGRGKVVEAARRILHESKSLVITAGAGMGVDSGLPDFRGVHGFWKAYPPIKKLGLEFAEMANPRWFVENPKLAWGFYGHRADLYRATRPHEGFSIMFNYAEKKMDGRYFVVTSNVDGHFQKAGYPASRVWEVHGSINRLQCVRSPNQCPLWDLPSEHKFDVDMSILHATEACMPRCPTCGSLGRPNALLFDDWHWVSDISDEQHNAFQAFMSNTENAPFAVFEFGAGTAVATIRYISSSLVHSYNAKRVQVNPQEADALSETTVTVSAGALETIREVFA